MRAVICGLMLALCINDANAADTIRVYGAGTESCGTYVSEPDSSDAKLIDVSWALGYMTAINEWQSMDKLPMETTDPDAIKVWLNNFCQSHPLDNFYTAVDKLAVALSDRAMKQK